MGRDWYDHGRTLSKKNTFYDFIDCTDYLIKNDYANDKKVYAMGGSAGGLLMGAVMNMRPELYHGIVAQVPFVDVMRLTVGGRAVAAGPHASAVTHGQCDALSRGEQPMLPPDIEGVSAPVYRHGHDSAVADVLLGDRGRQSREAVLGVGDLVLHDLHQSHPGLPGPEDTLGIGERSGAQHVEEQVVCELVVGALVVGQPYRSLALGGVDEPGAATARAQRAVEHGLREQPAFVVEQE